MKLFHRVLWIAGLALFCVTGVSAAEAPQQVDLPEAQPAESCLEAPDFANPADDTVPLGSYEKCVEACILAREACCQDNPGVCNNFPNFCAMQYYQCVQGC